MVSGTIRLPSGSRIRNIRLIERQIAHGPRLTDSALIAALNLNHPGLKAAAKAETPRDQLAAIATHFRNSAFNRRHIVPDPPHKADMAEADRILAGHIMGHHWPEGVDWGRQSLRVHRMVYPHPRLSLLHAARTRVGRNPGSEIRKSH